MKKLPAREIIRRCAALQKKQEDLDIGFSLIYQNVDRYYLSGTFQEGVLLLPTAGAGVLFVKRTLERAKEESFMDEILGFRKNSEVFDYIRDMHLATDRIGLEMDVVPSSIYLSIASHFPKAQFVDVSVEIRRLRAIKSGLEIGILREGGKRLDSALRALTNRLRPAMSEYEIFMELIGIFQKHDAFLLPRTRMFNMEVLPCTVLSGENAAKHSAMDSPSGGGEGITPSFPAGPSHKKVRRNEPILVDVAFSCDGYIVDCTRIFSFGRLDSTLELAHGISAECHSIFTECVRSGMPIPDSFEKIHDFVSKKGMSDVFMGNANFIGHGVGLELDEFPIIFDRYEDRLREGMVIAFEPKFVFDRGAVGYENTYCVQDGEAVSLSRFPESINCL
jgi:Xaa-Pro dipeptidase